MDVELKTRILELVEEKFPGWKGFEDPRFVEEEIDYKKAAIQKAQEELGREDLQRLLDQEDFDAIIKRIERRGRESHFMYLRIPKKGDLGILYDETLDKERFCQAFFDLVYGEGDSPSRMARFMAYVEENGHFVKWPFVTYFLFMIHPETDLFVKPQAITDFLKFIGADIDAYNPPKPDTYRKILSIAEDLKETLADFGPRDMVDIHSLIWVVSSGISGGKASDSGVEGERISCWWVNQGTSFLNDREKGVIWAGILDKAGNVLGHHENVSKLQPGDILLHYVRGKVCAVSIVKSLPTKALAGSVREDLEKDKEGWICEVEYHDFAEAIEYGWIPEHLLDPEFGPFTESGGVKQGYLFELSENFIVPFYHYFYDEWPEDVPPPVPFQTSFWMFQESPTEENLANRLVDLGDDALFTIEEWEVTRYGDEIHPGDNAFLWSGGTDAGIYAVGRIISEVWQDEDTGLDYVDVSLIHIYRPPILRPFLKNHQILSNLHVLKHPQGNNFIISEEEMESIYELAKAPSVDMVEPFNHVFTDLESALWAMEFTRKTLEKLGVTDKEDEKVAITYPGRKSTIRVNRGNWLILEFGHPKTGYPCWGIPVLKDEVPDIEDRAGFAFSQKDDEPPVGLAFFSFEEIMEMSEDLKSAFEGALAHIKARFSNWTRANTRKQHQNLIAEAVFDTERREAIIKGEVSGEGLKIIDDDDEYDPTEETELRGDGYDPPSFGQITERIRSEGLRLSDEVIQRYHLSLQSRKFVILSGISGTGKTWLAQAYAKAVGAKQCVIPVAPNWTTNEDLLGFFNPVDGQYHETEFTRFLRSASTHCKASQLAEKQPIPFHLILDEMNLARVEYYFAKFLSAMEIRQRGGVAEIELGPTGTVTLPPNLYFIGTVNIDETTHDFADKIYDRAQLIELPITREELEAHIGDAVFREVLLEIWTSVEPVKPFAYRIVDEIRVYLESAQEIDLRWETALDHQIHQKILPKLKGTEDHSGTALDDLVRITANRFPLSNAKAQRMREGFRRNGFVSYF